MKEREIIRVKAFATFEAFEKWQEKQKDVVIHEVKLHSPGADFAAKEKGIITKDRYKADLIGEKKSDTTTKAIYHTEIVVLYKVDAELYEAREKHRENELDELNFKQDLLEHRRWMMKKEQQKMLKDLGEWPAGDTSHALPLSASDTSGV